MAHAALCGLPWWINGQEPACHCRRCKETWVQSLGGEEPVEEEKATYPSILAWRIPWAEEPGRLQSKVLHKSQTWLSDLTTTNGSSSSCGAPLKSISPGSVQGDPQLCRNSWEAPWVPCPLRGHSALNSHLRMPSLPLQKALDSGHHCSRDLLPEWGPECDRSHLALPWKERQNLQWEFLFPFCGWDAEHSRASWKPLMFGWLLNTKEGGGRNESQWRKRSQSEVFLIAMDFPLF